METTTDDGGNRVQPVTPAGVSNLEITNLIMRMRTKMQAMNTENRRRHEETERKRAKNIKDLQRRLFGDSDEDEGAGNGDNIPNNPTTRLGVWGSHFKTPRRIKNAGSERQNKDEVNSRGYSDLERWMEEADKRYRKKCNYVYDHKFKTPFTDEVAEVQPTVNFKVPSFESYDGTMDPRQHIFLFEGKLVGVRFPPATRDGMLCKMFASTLRKSALNWFQSLKPNSVRSYGKLLDIFRRQFSTSIFAPKLVDHLFTISQRREETLRAYTKRFNEERLNVEGCSEEMVVQAYKNGLDPHQKFFRWLTIEGAERMDQILTMAEKFIDLEEVMAKKGEKRKRENNVDFRQIQANS